MDRRDLILDLHPYSETIDTVPPPAFVFLGYCLVCFYLFFFFSEVRWRCV